MKRRYEIEKQRAVNEFRRLAAKENPTVQMMLPMAEIVGLLQLGVGHLLREAGLALMSLVMEEEVHHLAGERHEQHDDHFDDASHTPLAIVPKERREALVRTCLHRRVYEELDAMIGPHPPFPFPDRLRQHQSKSIEYGSIRS